MHCVRNERKLRLERVLDRVLSRRRHCEQIGRGGQQVVRALLVERKRSDGRVEQRHVRIRHQTARRHIVVRCAQHNDAIAGKEEEESRGIRRGHYVETNSCET